MMLSKRDDPDGEVSGPIDSDFAYESTYYVPLSLADGSISPSDRSPSSDSHTNELSNLQKL